jgi:nucleoside-diphosphate-sugar epimerase
MKRILITGSLGYLGSVLTSYLSENEFNVVGYDTAFFKDALIYQAAPSETIFNDVRMIAEKDLVGFDAVVHLAGISNDPVGKLNAALIYDPTRSYSLNLAKMCKKNGIKFIFASSCSVYGLGSEEFLTETSNTNPQTFYSLNKLQIEGDLQSISDKDFSPIALRFATVYGPSPRIRFDVVINMLAGMAISKKSIVLNSDGLSWRPNLHILDACQAIKCAIDLDYHAGELLVLNVGDNNDNLQIIQIAEIIQKAVPGCKLKFLSEDPDLDKDGLIRDRKIKNGIDVRTYKVNFDKIKKILPDFKCKWSVETGVNQMVKKFEGLSLSSSQFSDRGFYRLQRLEDLHAQGYLSDELFWLKQRE